MCAAGVHQWVLAEDLMAVWNKEVASSSPAGYETCCSCTMWFSVRFHKCKARISSATCPLQFLVFGSPSPKCLIHGWWDCMPVFWWQGDVLCFTSLINLYQASAFVLLMYLGNLHIKIHKFTCCLSKASLKVSCHSTSKLLVTAYAPGPCWSLLLLHASCHLLFLLTSYTFSYT